MAGSFTNHAEDLVLDWLLTTNSATRPTSWYVGLFTDNPSDAGSGTEISGNNYTRKAVTFSVSGDSPTLATNTTAIEFDTASGSWGTITHIGIFDASTSGNMLAHADLTASKTIGTGDVFRIPAGDLDITLD
jgi:hypothetical protein